MTPRSIRYLRRRKDDKYWENKKKEWHKVTKEFYETDRIGVVYGSFKDLAIPFGLTSTNH